MSLRKACLSLAAASCCALATITVVAAKDTAKEPELKSGIDRATFDTNIKPGQDFYQYVNGAWIKNNPIPAEYSRWAPFRSCVTTTSFTCARSWTI